MEILCLESSSPFQIRGVLKARHIRISEGIGSLRVYFLDDAFPFFELSFVLSG